MPQPTTRFSQRSKTPRTKAGMTAVAFRFVSCISPIQRTAAILKMEDIARVGKDCGGRANCLAELHQQRAMSGLPITAFRSSNQTGLCCDCPKAQWW